MNSTPLPTRSASDRVAGTDEDTEVKDTEIILHRYNFHDIPSEFRKMGKGTPKGDRFSLPHRLVPVPRWLAPKSMSSFNVPQRQTPYTRDPRNAKNFRTLCWMHTESGLLAKSPLNDTGHRASMPARPQVPLNGSMFYRQQRPSQALRAFGTLLPGSTPQSYKLSVPVGNVNGHIFRGTSKTPKPARVLLQAPPPGVTASSVLHPCHGGPRVMVHRMNLARQKWNTAKVRTRRLSLYTQLVSEVIPPTSEYAEPILPELRRVIHDINGICAYAKKMAAIEGTETRHMEAGALSKVCDFFHKLLQTEQTLGMEPSDISPQGPNSLREDSAVANMAEPVDTQDHYTPTPEPTAEVALPTVAQESYHDSPPRSTDVSTSMGSSSQPSTGPSHPMPNDSIPIIQHTHEAPPDERQRSPIAPGPKLRQKRSRVPVPSTRILRSMTKVKEDRISVTAVAPCSTPTTRVVFPSTQPQKQTKGKHISSSSTALVGPSPVVPRYNLRSRKRELDEGGASSQDKQVTRPAKRRRA